MCALVGQIKAFIPVFKQPTPYNFSKGLVVVKNTVQYFMLNYSARLSMITFVVWDTSNLLARMLSCAANVLSITQDNLTKKHTEWLVLFALKIFHINSMYVVVRLLLSALINMYYLSKKYR